MASETTNISNGGKNENYRVKYNRFAKKKKTFNKTVEVLSSANNHYNLFLIISCVCSHTFAPTQGQSQGEISQLLAQRELTTGKSNINSVL